MEDMEALYAQHYGAVYRFALSLCRDAKLAEEIAQDTFLKALTHVETFQARCHVKTWLCQIAKHRYYDLLRRRGRDTPAHPQEAPAENAAASPEAWFADREQVERIHRHLHAMEDPYREVFTLRVLGELSHGQIAALFSKSEAWARTTYYRAKVRLQERMKADENQ